MSVMDLAVITETEGWRTGDITNQLYVGPVWSGASSFTAPVILMGATLFTLPRLASTDDGTSFILPLRVAPEIPVLSTFLFTISS